jgi:hypothetical protein
MDRAAGEPPKEKGIDGAEGELAALRPVPGAGHVVEDPGGLGAGEVGVEEEAGLPRHRGLVPGRLQPGAELGRAPVLPDDAPMHGLSGGAVPDDRGLALVGDADRGDVGGGRSGLP